LFSTKNKIKKKKQPSPRQSGTAYEERKKLNEVCIDVTDLRNELLGPP